MKFFGLPIKSYSGLRSLVYIKNTHLKNLAPHPSTAYFCFIRAKREALWSAASLRSRVFGSLVRSVGFALRQRSRRGDSALERRVGAEAEGTFRRGQPVERFFALLC